mmetsp:Transcript_14232/g.31839  ORF Transcript_14232/g.31839 Transcript_14232/m.31839 type:complete len:208 (-) Transcript_14232:2273-2896(-)
MVVVHRLHDVAKAAHHKKEEDHQDQKVDSSVDPEENCRQHAEVVHLDFVTAEDVFEHRDNESVDVLVHKRHLRFLLAHTPLLPVWIDELLGSRRRRVLYPESKVVDKFPVAPFLHNPLFAVGHVQLLVSFCVELCDLLRVAPFVVIEMRNPQFVHYVVDSRLCFCHFRNVARMCRNHLRAGEERAGHGVRPEDPGCVDQLQVVHRHV